MIIRFITPGFRAIKCLRIRHKGLICMRVRFNLSLFFVVLKIVVVLDDNWYFLFFDWALVDRMILVWIWQVFATPKARYF